MSRQPHNPGLPTESLSTKSDQTLHERAHRYGQNQRFQLRFGRNLVENQITSINRLFFGRCLFFKPTVDWTMGNHRNQFLDRDQLYRRTEDLLGHDPFQICTLQKRSKEVVIAQIGLGATMLEQGQGTPATELIERAETFCKQLRTRKRQQLICQVFLPEMVSGPFPVCAHKKCLILFIAPDSNGKLRCLNPEKLSYSLYTLLIPWSVEADRHWLGHLLEEKMRSSKPLSHTDLASACSFSLSIISGLCRELARFDKRFKASGKAIGWRDPLYPLAMELQRRLRQQSRGGDTTYLWLEDRPINRRRLKKISHRYFGSDLQLIRDQEHAEGLKLCNAQRWLG